MSRKDILKLVAEPRDKYAEGQTNTIMPFLSVIRRNQPTTFAPGVLTPSLCLIVQGVKKIHIGKDVIEYRAGDFVTSVIDIPAAGQIVGATKSSPYYGLRVDFSTKEIAGIITEAKIKVETRERKLNTGAFVGTASDEILEVFVKLLELADKPKEAPFLSSLLKREMIFRLLTGEYGYLFMHKVLFDQNADGVGSAIQWIRQNYSTTFTVEELAKSNGMSISGLHHKFKAITTMGPLQYQKQLRLQEARRLLLSGAVDATTAALQVGYESPSQFNREYRRLFGLPPLKDIKSILNNSRVLENN